MQKCLAIIAVQRRIEEERQGMAQAMAGYPYGHRQTEETTIQTRTQDAVEVDVLASAAGNGGTKCEGEEGDIEVEDSPSKRAETVEESAYPPPVPATAPTSGGIEG